MKKTVLLLPFGPAAEEAARWFATHGDRVYFAGKNAPGGTFPLPADPLDPVSLSEAIRKIQQDAGLLDILVLGIPHTADEPVGAPHDYDAMLQTMTDALYGCRAWIEACLPLLEKGMKRIAAITKPESSNSWSTGENDLAYSASLAALNMMGKIHFNRLRPQGYTFRWYCQSDVTGGMCAAEYISSSLCYDEKQPTIHSDENRFTLRDAYLREISW